MARNTDALENPSVFFDDDGRIEDSTHGWLVEVDSYLEEVWTLISIPRDAIFKSTYFRAQGEEEQDWDELEHW